MEMVGAGVGFGSFVRLRFAAAVQVESDVTVRWGVET